MGPKNKYNYDNYLADTDKRREEMDKSESKSITHSLLNEIVRSQGIPSPLKWNCKTRRRIKNNNGSKPEYLPQIHDYKDKRKNSSSISSENLRGAKSSLDINDIEGARPQPLSFIRRKQQIMNSIEKNSHTLPNSGRITPLILDRRYDSRRYMRVDDIDPHKPGKIIVPVGIPKGLHEGSNIMEYKGIPKQQKLKAQQGRLPFTRRYSKEKYGDDNIRNNDHSILYHINQTDKDFDRDMNSRRFKAELRGSQDPNSSYSNVKSRSMRSIKIAKEIPPSKQRRVVPNSSQLNKLRNIPSQREKKITLVKSSQKISPSQRKIFVNSKYFRKLPPPPFGYEYFEEISVEEEESEEEHEKSHY